MSNRLKVAAVMPVHPARFENGLYMEAIDSIRQQTRPVDGLFVAVDTEGEGAAPTRHRALMSVPVEYDFVAFLDSDDVWMPRHLELLLAHQAKTGADMVYSWFKILMQDHQGHRNILEDDPIFPATHYLNEFDPNDPIETTITTLCRRSYAQAVGMHALDRGQVNSGEDRSFVLGLIKEGATIKHLRRKTWLWRHWWTAAEVPGNTSGLPTRGDAAA